SKDIERTVTEFARGSNCGLIVVASPLINNNSNLIISLAARHRLPATYPWRSFVTAGGLISYGPDAIDAHRQAAGYVDRILKGEKPGDLPVQAPTKYELASFGLRQNLADAVRHRRVGTAVIAADCARRRGDRCGRPAAPAPRAATAPHHRATL